MFNYLELISDHKLEFRLKKILYILPRIGIKFPLEILKRR